MLKEQKKFANSNNLQRGILMIAGVILLLGIIVFVMQSPGGGASSDTDKVGLILIGMLGFLAAVFGIVAIVSFKSISSNKCMIEVDKFLSNHPTVTLEQIDADMKEGKRISQSLWVGKSFIVGVNLFYLEIIAISELVWVYYYSDRNDPMNNHIVFINNKKEEINVPAGDKVVKNVFDAIAVAAPKAIIGFDDEVDHLYQNDFESFLKLRFNK